MRSSNKPKNLTMPFAAGGAYNSIPNESQVGVSPGKASMVDGFPPATRTPRAAGGVPPDGLDMNGILHDVSAGLMYSQAYGALPWDSDFAKATGYPKNAIVNYNGLLYQSLNEDNKAAPSNATAWGAVKGVTPAADTKDNSIATAEFVNSAIKNANPAFGGTAEAGYYVLPNGIIHQWGTAHILEGEPRIKYITLPIVFPNACFIVNANDHGSWCVPVGCTYQDNSTIQLFIPSHAFMDDSGVAKKISGLVMHWQAIGY